MNPIIKILKNSTLLSISILIERVAGLALAWYVARFAGGEVWGEYNTVLSFVLIGATVGPWGLNTLLPREIGRSKENLESYLGSAVFIGTLITISIIVILATIIFFLDYPPIIATTIYLALGIAILPQVEGFLLEAAIIGIEHMEWVVLARFPTTLLRLLASISLLQLGYGIRMLFVLWGLYHLIVVVIYYILLKKAFSNFQFRTDRKLISRFFFLTLPFAITAGFTEVFGQVDKVFLSKLRDLESVGIYATGILLIQLIIMLAPSLMDSLFPSLSRLFIQSKENFEHVILLLTKLLVVLFFPITILILSFADFIILTVFGNDYFDSIIILRMTALIILPSYVSRVWYRTTLASNHEKKGIAVAIVGGIAQISLNALFIPRFGLIGAGYAFVATVFIRTMHNLINANSILENNLVRLAMKIAIIIAISGSIYLFFFQQDQYAIATILSLLLFYGLLFISKTIAISDVQNIQMLQKS